MFNFRQLRKEEEDGEDDASIQIITSSDRTSCLSHEQTQVEATPAAASLHNENSLINGMTLQEYKSSLKRDLYVYARHNIWDKAQSIYEEFPDMVRDPLTASGDTALHVAVSANCSVFVQELVNLMTPQDLEILNADGDTAFIMATITGNGDILQIMITKNENLAVIPGFHGMLPVLLAALNGYQKMVQDLSSQNLLEIMASKDIERLFLMTISCSMYDVAMELLGKYPADLAIARGDQGQLTALHMLARKHSEQFDMQEDNGKEASAGGGHELQLLKKLWSQVRQLEKNMMLELITEPSAVLFDAVKSGNVEAVKWLLYMDRELLMIKDPKNGRSLLHFAVLYRQRSIFNIILKMETATNIIRAMDKDRNNVLHCAALQLEEASSLTSNMQMRRALEWFQEVEKRAPLQLKKMKNSDDKTPRDIFYVRHREFSDKLKDDGKGFAKSGMVVATLVVNVAFAATLTVPADKTNAWFIVFILANAVALFTSAASIVSFLSTFTSNSKTSEFIFASHPSLIMGLWLLFYSITAMVIAFVAASFLIFDHTAKWVAYVVASMGLLPILRLRAPQFRVLDGFTYFWYKNRLLIKFG